MIFVDSRWNGKHGIGRFSTEVTSRLTVETRPLLSNIRPSSPTDVLTPARLLLKPSDLVYSPAYNCGPTRARQILTIHDLIHLDDESQSSKAKSIYYERLVKPTVRRAGVVLTVSEASRQRIIRWLDDSSVDVRVVGNGSSAAFSPVSTPDAFAAPRFLYVGNLRSHKNVPVVLDALRQRPAYRLTMVVPDEAEAAALAAAHGVAAQVDVRSGLDDTELALAYSGAVATVLPSLQEGFGFPALESVLCGTPVLYWSGCASVAEISNGSGLGVAEASDPQEWSNAMDQAVSNRASMLLADPGFWRDKYDWQKVASAVDQVLSSYEFDRK